MIRGKCSKLISCNVYFLTSIYISRPFATNVLKEHSCFAIQVLNNLSCIRVQQSRHTLELNEKHWKLLPPAKIKMRRNIEMLSAALLRSLSHINTYSLT